MNAVFGVRKKMFGDVIIQEDWTEIPKRFFKGNKKITSVTIPKTIRKIGAEAFAECENLEKVILQEGLETIGEGAFSECERLRNINLPEGLKTINHYAFLSSGLNEITIPNSVRAVGEYAFWLCKKLTKVTILNQETKLGAKVFYECNNIKEAHYGGLTESDRSFHLMGLPFLAQHTETSANFHHANNTEFMDLVSQCTKGDANAMNSLAEWFEKMSRKWLASKFYMRASNYWRYRAYRKEQKNAIEWFNRYFAKNPGEQLESIISESCDHRGKYEYHHNIPGNLLNDLGFAFFDPERKYDIRKYDCENIVEASSFSKYVGPDEDGFGEEWYYDWWFLDENMQPIPGINRIRAEVKETDQEQFQEMRAKAIAIVKQKL